MSDKNEKLASAELLLAFHHKDALSPNTHDQERPPIELAPVVANVQQHADAHATHQIGSSALIIAQRAVTHAQGCKKTTHKAARGARKPRVKQSREEHGQKVREYRFGMSSTMHKAQLSLGLPPNANLEEVLTEVSKVLPALVAAEAVRLLA